MMNGNIKLLVLKVSTRKHLANIFATYLFGGYCVPFKVNEDSPNLLKLDFGSHMFQETKFEMENQCKWSGFEDTYAMRFTNVEYGEAKLTPPESVADRFRQFSNPFFDPSFLLNKSTLENVGMLLPANTTYIARWAQLPIFSDEERTILENSVRCMCSLNHYQEFYPLNALQHCIKTSFLFSPRALFPDPETRRKITEWANDKNISEIWHAPWQLQPKHVSYSWLKEEMNVKYGPLGKMYFDAYRSRERGGEGPDANTYANPLPKFVANSIHWPNIHPIIPTQPASKINEETVLKYMKSLQEASDEYSRPTVLLLEMKAGVHLETVYFILDGHHKLVAMQRLVANKKRKGVIDFR